MASEALRKAGQVQHLAAMQACREGDRGGGFETVVGRRSDELVLCPDVRQDALKQFDLPRIRARRWEPGMPGYHNLLAEAMRSVGCAFSELGDYEEATGGAIDGSVRCLFQYRLALASMELLQIVQEQTRNKDAIVDPPLTCLGIQDAKDLWPKAKTLKPELLVVSPLKRASETIMIGFKEAIQQGVPLMAHDACREQFGVHVCDRRGTRTDYAERWPHVDVSCVTHDEDPSSLTKRESKVELARRGHDFLQWLSGRPEKEIVVGTHSAFLMGVFHIALEIEDESMKNFFKTGELRSVLLEVQAEQSAKRRKL
ncbi:unnamed protein product [Durusdinium trenchii]|uniref:Uncharacterized protein n=1 Tax=Durusdinium trenchii TaxID=1381693 RepID=A0ABP0MMS6_9DINO